MGVAREDHHHSARATLYSFWLLHVRRASSPSGVLHCRASRRPSTARSGRARSARQSGGSCGADLLIIRFRVCTRETSRNAALTRLALITFRLRTDACLAGFLGRLAVRLSLCMRSDVAIEEVPTAQQSAHYSQTGLSRLYVRSIEAFAALSALVRTRIVVSLQVSTEVIRVLVASITKMVDVPPLLVYPGGCRLVFGGFGSRLVLWELGIRPVLWLCLYGRPSISRPQTLEEPLLL